MKKGPTKDDIIKAYNNEIIRLTGWVERLQEQLREIQQELQIRINDNADMYAKLCNALMQLEEANDTLKKIAIAISCDPADVKVIMPEYCVEQDVLDNCNKYFEKWGVK